MSQLDLTLNPPPKTHHNKLSPELGALKREKIQAHRVFKLLKSNKFKSFSESDKLLLKKYYNISL